MPVHPRFSLRSPCCAPASRPSEQGDTKPPESGHTFTARPGTTPLVLDSPHSGTVYPDDFRAALPLHVLRQAEDTHVEKIYDFASDIGAAWVEAHFPRIYLDANRDISEIDVQLFESDWPGEVTADEVTLQKVRLGKGLIWRFTDKGEPIYERQLSVEEGQNRIAACWMPYHAAVAEAIDAAHARHGYSIHINCHSMPSVAASHATLHPGLEHADFVIGDRDGSTASPRLSALICDFLRARGYDVAYNHPYKGVELVRRNGQPDAHRHSIQIEVNRKIYMNEETLDIIPDGMQRLRADLRDLMVKLASTDPRTL